MVFGSVAFGRLCPRVTPDSGSAHGIARVQGVSRSDNLCSQRAEDGSPL